MPSIIGSSTIFNKDLVSTTITGPTGPTGFIGPIGSPGPTGITAGPTGNDGIYIKDVDSNLAADTISFELSNGIFINLNGFKGPGYGTYSDSRGICSATGSEYISIFSGISSGLTFSFLGISGTQKTGVIPSLTENNTKILLNFIDNFNDSVVGLCGSSAGYLLHINDKFQVIPTTIGITSYFQSPLPTEIEQLYGITSTLFLNFNEIKNENNPIQSIQNYTDFDHKIYTIKAFPRGGAYTGTLDDIVVAADPQKGLEIIISEKYSAYYIETPTAIKSITFSPTRSKKELPTRPETFRFFDYNFISEEYFNYNTLKLPTTIDHVVFFINNGSEIWDFPRNVSWHDYFSGWHSNDYEPFNFTPGMNILNVFNHNSYNPERQINGIGTVAVSFFERSLGYSGAYHFRYEGACCYVDDGGISRCLENSTFSECQILNGSFSSLENCNNACVNLVDGYCCHPVSGCGYNVNPELCAKMGGTWVKLPSPIELANAGTPLDPGAVLGADALCEQNCNSSLSKATRTELNTLKLNRDTDIITFPGSLNYRFNPYDLLDLTGAGGTRIYYWGDYFPTHTTYVRTAHQGSFAEFEINQPDSDMGVILRIFRPSFRIRQIPSPIGVDVEEIDLTPYLKITCVGCGPLGEDETVFNFNNRIFKHGQKIKLEFAPEKFLELISRLSYGELENQNPEFFSKYRPRINVFYITFKPNVITGIYYYFSTDFTYNGLGLDPFTNFPLRYANNQLFWKFGLLVPPPPPPTLPGACLESNNTKYYQGVYEATRKCLYCQSPDGKLVPLQRSLGTISVCLSTNPSFYWTDSSGNPKYYKINCIRGITANNLNDCSYSLYNNPSNPNAANCKHALYEDVLPIESRTGFAITETSPNFYEIITNNPYDCKPGTACSESIFYQDSSNSYTTCKGLTNGSYYYDEIKTNIFDFALANLPSGSTLPFIIRDQIIEELRGMTVNYVYPIRQENQVNTISFPKKLLFTWEGAQANITSTQIPPELNGVNRKCCTSIEYYNEQEQLLRDTDLLNLPLNPCKCDTEQKHLGPPDESIFNFNGHKTQILDFYDSFTSEEVTGDPVISYTPLTKGNVDTYGETNTPPGVFKSVSSGYFHTLAINTNNEIVAWGAGTTPITLSEINDPEGSYDRISINQAQSVIPDELIGVPVSKVVGGSYHSAAIDLNGNVYCWGAGRVYDDPILVPSSLNRGQSIVPPEVRNVVDVALGGLHTVALKSDGTVVCWGWNYYGQCDTPEDLVNVVKISAGGFHTIAIKADGTTVVWGKNGPWTQENGNLNTEIRQIVSGVDYTLILKNDNTLRQLGGSFIIPTSQTAIKIAASRYYPVLQTSPTNLRWYTPGVKDKELSIIDFSASASNVVALARERIATSAEQYEYWVYAASNSNFNQCHVPYKCAVPCDPGTNPLCQDTEETQYEDGTFTEFSLKTSVNTLFFKMKIDSSGNLEEEKPDCIIVKPGCFYSYSNEQASENFYSGLGGANCFIDYSSPDYTCANDGSILGDNDKFSDPSFRYIGRIKKSQTAPVSGSPDLGFVQMTLNFSRDAQGPIGNATSTVDGCWFTLAGAYDTGCNEDAGEFSAGIPCSAAKDCAGGPPPNVCEQAAKRIIQFNDKDTFSPYQIDLSEFRNGLGQSLTPEQIRIIKYAKEQYFKNALLSSVCKTTAFSNGNIDSGAASDQTGNRVYSGATIKKELQQIVCSPETNNCSGGLYTSRHSGFWSNAAELGISVNTYCSNTILDNFDDFDIVISVDKTEDGPTSFITPTIFKVNKRTAVVTKDTSSYIHYTDGETTQIKRIKSGNQISTGIDGYSRQHLFLYTDGSNKPFEENQKQIKQYLIFDNINDGDIILTDIGLNFNSVVTDYQQDLTLGFADSIIQLNYFPVGNLELTKQIIKNRIGANYTSMQFSEVNYITWKPRKTSEDGSKNSFDLVVCDGCAYGACGNADSCFDGSRSESALDGPLTIYTNGLVLSDGVDLTGRIFLDGIIQYQYTIYLNDGTTVNRTHMAYKKEEKYFTGGTNVNFVGLNIGGVCTCVDCADPENFEICTSNRYCNVNGSCSP